MNLFLRLKIAVLLCVIAMFTLNANAQNGRFPHISPNTNAGPDEDYDEDASDNGNCICPGKRQLKSKGDFAVAGASQTIEMIINFYPELKPNDEVILYFKDSLDNELIADYKGNYQKIKDNGHLIKANIINDKFIARTACRNFRIDMQVTRAKFAIPAIDASGTLDEVAKRFVDSIFYSYPSVVCSFAINFGNTHDDCNVYIVDNLLYVKIARYNTTIKQLRDLKLVINKKSERKALTKQIERLEDEVEKLENSDDENEIESKPTETGNKKINNRQTLVEAKDAKANTEKKSGNAGPKKPSNKLKGNVLNFSIQ